MKYLFDMIAIEVVIVVLPRKKTPVNNISGDLRLIVLLSSENKYDHDTEEK